MSDGVELQLGGLAALEDRRALEPRLRTAAGLALATGGGRDGELSLTFLEPAAMRELNRRWLGRDALTDVIAFDLGAPDGPMVGDVYVCPAAARSAAREPDGPPLEEELVRLVVHGVLHVLGHEHPEDEGRWRSPMYRLQEELVERALAAPAQGGAEPGPPGERAR